MDALSAVTHAMQVLAQFNQLSTFEAVAEWDDAAAHAVAALRAQLAAIDTELARLAAARQTAEAERQAKNPLARVFSRNPLAEIDRQADAARTRQAELTAIIERLEAAIEQTPDSPADQRVLLADLKLAKKELALRKRELTQAMRNVREATRSRNAKVGVGFMAALISSPTSRRYQRIAIRMDREAQLRPHEDQRDAIDRQLLELDRMILWVQRFK